MSKKVEKWAAEDGTLHDSESVADRYTALKDFLTNLDDMDAVRIYEEDISPTAEALARDGWTVSKKDKE